MAAKSSPLLPLLDMACFTNLPYWHCLSLSSPVPNTPKSDKVLALENPSSSKSSVFCSKLARNAPLAAFSPKKSSSFSSPTPVFTPNPQILSSAVAGAALVSSLLVALVLILKLGRKRRFVQRSIVRRSHDSKELKDQRFLHRSVLRRCFESNDAFRDLDLRLFVLPSVRASLGSPRMVFDSAFVGFTNPAEVPLLNNGVALVRFESPTRRPELSGKGASDVLIDVSSEPAGLLDEQVEVFDASNASNSSRNQVLLPIVSAACLEIPGLRVMSMAEQEELPAKTEFQAAIPAIAMVAGAFGALTTGVDGGLELVGFIAATSFIVYDILWVSKRRKLWADLMKITDREKLVHFLTSRKLEYGGRGILEYPCPRCPSNSRVLE